MVDFNNQTTVGTPAVDIVRVLILERRANLFEAIESYTKQEHQGISPSISVVQARLYVLFLELQAQFKRKLDKKEYDILHTQVKSKKIDDIMGGLETINNYLDQIKLTMLDNKKVYDPTSVENENKIKGLG